jgi:hypothetical protein
MENHHSHNCLNCNQTLNGNFCQNCGQKATTHRYSIQHFLAHDLVHGWLHFDKGLLYTLKALFTRPGHSIREYIEGKRAQHYNFVALMLIGIVVSIFLDPYIKVSMVEIGATTESSKKMLSEFDEFSTKYPKLVMAIYIPIYSLFTLFWFRKAKYNFSEHLVLNSYKTVGETVVGLFFKVLTIFYANVAVLKLIYWIFIITFSSFVYPIWFYGQFFSKSGYTKWGLIWRSLMIIISITLIAGIFSAISMFLEKGISVTPK